MLKMVQVRGRWIMSGVDGANNTGYTVEWVEGKWFACFLRRNMRNNNQAAGMVERELVERGERTWLKLFFLSMILSLFRWMSWKLNLNLFPDWLQQPKRNPWIASTSSVIAIGHLYLSFAHLFLIPGMEWEIQREWETERRESEASYAAAAPGPRSRTSPTKPVLRPSSLHSLHSFHPSHQILRWDQVIIQRDQIPSAIRGQWRSGKNERGERTNFWPRSHRGQWVAGEVTDGLATRKGRENEGIAWQNSRTGMGWQEIHTQRDSSSQR